MNKWMYNHTLQVGLKRKTSSFRRRCPGLLTSYTWWTACTRVLRRESPWLVEAPSRDLWDSDLSANREAHAGPSWPQGVRFYFKWKAEGPLTGTELTWSACFIKATSVTIRFLCVSIIMGNQGWWSTEWEGKTMMGDETLATWLWSISVTTSFGPILDSGRHHGNITEQMFQSLKKYVYLSMYQLSSLQTVSMQIQMSFP